MLFAVATGRVLMTRTISPLALCEASLTGVALLIACELFVNPQYNFQRDSSNLGWTLFLGIVLLVPHA
jgi:hypothetical protein